MKFTIHNIESEESKVIQSKNWFQEFVEKYGKKKTILCCIGFLAILLVLFGIFLIHSLVSGDTDSGLFGIETDETGHTNILFLGVAGENGNEGYNLADSIILASIKHDPASISFVSIPRDLWLDSPLGERKINSIYASSLSAYGEQKALNIIKETVGKFTGVTVHHATVVDFQIFIEAIDAIGGIDIYVPESIQDPFFPGPNFSYETFIVRQGQQTFDGETSLKYARSRKTTSDYDRAQRQQDILLAIRKKASELNLFTDVGKLTSLYNIYSKNVNTDISLTDAINLAKLASKISYDNALSFVLNNDENQMGGLLYAPEDHSPYGQFVVIPRNLGRAKLFFTLALKHPDILLEKEQIEILNASSTPGLAGKTAKALRQIGFVVVNIDNAEIDPAPKYNTIQTVNDAPKSQTYYFLEDVYGTQEPTMDTTIQQPADSIATLRFIIGAEDNAQTD